MSEQLGRAELELGADLAPLDRDLAKAERRVAVSVAAMQRMLDSLHGELDMRIGAAEALAEKLAASAVPRSGETVVVERAAPSVTRSGSGEAEVWGIRGPQHAGSLTNPIVTVLAASKLFPMGSYGAAIGEDNTTDVQRGDSSSGVASAAELAALTAAVNDLAQNITPGNQLASAGTQGVAEPGGPERTVVALDAANGNALNRAVTAMENMAQTSKRDLSAWEAASTKILSPAERKSVYLGVGRFQNYDKQLTQLSRAELNLLAAGRGIESAGGLATKADVAAAIAAMGDRGLPRSNAQTVIDSARTTINNNGATTILPTRSAAGSGSGVYGTGSSTTDRVIFAWPGAGGGGNNTGGGIPVIFGGAGGGGGNRRIDIFHHASGGGDNSGGGAATTAATTGLLARLGLGGGTAGLAAFGSALSFAGLGFEHLITTALGILGSATAAAGGGGLLALGSLGKLGVGGGSDILATRTAAANVQTLNTDLNNLSQAVAVYGKNSTQAAQAQAQLNYDLQGMGKAGPAAMQVAQQLQNLDNQWSAASVGAQKQADLLFAQVLHLASTFVPLVAQAAQTNLGIINTGLKPLFAWLEGPQGIQIFRQLEQAFAQELPTAVHAFDQGLELLLRVMNIASQYTGGFVTHLDELLTRWNSLSNAQLGNVVQRYVDDFRLWDTFVKLLVTDLFDLFHQDVGTGNSIIATLNGMLEKLHAYETSAHGSAQLQNIFEVHKTEIDDLLKLLPELGGAFAHVYLAIAPGAVTVMNDVVLPVLDALAKALDDISKASPLAADALGAVLIGAKFGGWSAVTAQLTKVRGLLLGTAAAETDVAAAGAGSAGSTAVKVATPGILEKGGFSLGAFLAGRGFAGAGVTAANLGTDLTTVLGGALRTGLAGIGGFIAGDMARSLLHIGQGGDSKSGSLIGTVVGGALGTLAGPIGTAIGASAGNVIGGVIGSMFGHGAVTFHQNPGSIISDKQLGGIQPGDVVQIREIGNFSQYSITQLEHLQAALAKPGIKVVVNGVPEAVASVRQVVGAALQTRQDAAAAFNTAQDYISQFWMQAENHSVRGANGMVTIVQPKLGQIVDAYKSSMRAIANFVGIGTAQGRDLVKQNTQDMVEALTIGMRDGQVSVKQGMAELNTVLAAGLSDNAITWQTDWTDMFTTVQNLYDNGKISTKTYFSDIHDIVVSGWRAIQRSTQAALTQYDNSQKVAFISGQEEFSTYQTNIHNAQLRANRLQHSDLGQWETNLIASMKKSGAVANVGMAGIVKQLDAALGPLGATKIPIPVLAAENFGGTAPGGGGFAGTSFASGGLTQIGRPGEAGRDTVPLNVGGTNVMVAPGELVAVINRHQIGDFNARFADYGGLGGYFGSHKKPNYMAEGGLVPGYGTGGPIGGAGSPASTPYVYPFPGLTPGRTDQGYDFSGAGPLYALGPGRVLTTSSGTGAGMWGWPGVGGLVYQLSSGPRAGSNVYYNENVNPQVGSGQSVFAGQAIATLLAGHPDLEAGWANSSATGPLTPYNGAPDGTPMPGGVDFTAFINALRTGGPLPAGGSGVGSVGAVAALLWKALKSPKVSGSGAMADIVRAGLGDVTTAANAYGSKAVARINATTAGAIGGAVGGAGGVGVAAWLAAARPLAAAHGWDAAQIQSWLGIEHYEDQSLSLTAQNPTSPAYGLAQGITGPSWYAAHGGNSTTLVGQLTAMANYIAGRYGTPSAALAYEIANHSYAAGGLLPMLMAAGGVTGANLTPGGMSNRARRNAQGQILDSKTGKVIPAQFLGAHRPKKRPARHRAAVGPAGLPNPGEKGGDGGNTISSQWPVPAMPGSGDMQSIRGTVSLLNTLLGSGSTDQSGVEWATEQMNYWPQLWAVQNPTAWAITSDPTQAVITTDPVTGQPVAPYLDQKDINIAIGWLTQQLGWEQQMIGDITSSVPVSVALQKQVKAAIEKRRDEIKQRQADIKKRREQIQDNLKKRTQLLAKIAANNKLIAANRSKIAAGSRNKTPASTIYGWQAQIAGWQTQNQGYAGQVNVLETENKLLGGSKTSLGTGGQIGVLASQNTRLDNQITGSTGLQFALGLVSNPGGQYSPDGLEGVTGRGGLLGPDEVQLFTLEQQLLALSPDALKKVLAKAQAQANPLTSATLTGTTAFSYQGQTYVAGEGAGTPGMASGGMIDLNGLLSNQTARFAAMANLPDFAGTFHTGGVIPGVPGTEKLALVQSGETITPIGGGTSSQAIMDLTEALRENTRETRSNTGALSSSTSGGGVSYTRSSLSSDRVELLSVGS